ncbi:MAG: hypothetical protein JNN07_04595 [Verrucomicrobiales bacterium]|nr:hypothetical protein [Verrucomicrobiales bacterium]
MLKRTAIKIVLYSLLCSLLYTESSAAERDGANPPSSNDAVAAVNALAPQILRERINDLRDVSGAYLEVIKGIKQNSVHIMSTLSAMQGEVTLSSNINTNTVLGILTQHGIGRSKLNRFQVRVFKRFKIIQGPLYIDRSDPGPAARELFETRLEAGDILWIVPSRE